MDASDLIIEGLKEARVSLVACLPDSLLKSTYRRLLTEKEIRVVFASNEADLPGIVAGGYLGGMRTIMMMENSGVRQACEPIARFAFSYHLPLVMMLTLRGGFPESHWWGHAHAQTVGPILSALRIPQLTIRYHEEIKPSIRDSFIHAHSSQWPIALVLTGDCVES